MGWRGALRSIAAAQRAAAREAVRQHKQYERMAKHEAKLEALRQAAFEVERYENWIARITSVHRDCGSPWDWSQIVAAPAPVSPSATNAAELHAQQAVDRYEPSFADRLFRRGEKKRAALRAAVEAARAQDSAANAAAQQEFAARYSDWDDMRGLASRIVAMDPGAFRDATGELNPFEELSELGSRISFAFRGDGVGVAALVVNGESVIPSEAKSLLQSGKLSTKKMPQGRFYELYQDYVAGATLRIARELFALLPLHTVYVSAIGNMLDPASGHMRDQPILSVMIPRSTLSLLRFEALDPSEGLRNFRHEMDFRKTKGFTAIQPILPEGMDLPAT